MKTKRFFRYFWRIIGVLCLTLALLELVYRQYWFDFYGPEWRGLNTAVAPAFTGKKVLFFGDSFTAQPDSYVPILRDSAASIQLYNAAVPGTCALAHLPYLKNRIQSVNPDAVVVQLYVGNDLIDVQKPINWRKLSWKRNVFWKASEYATVLGFLNYRLGQWTYALRSDARAEATFRTSESFDAARFNAREKLYLNADSNFVEQSVFVEGRKINEARQLTSALSALRKQLGPEVPLYVLVLPHCAQIGAFYRDNLVQIGMKNAHGDALFTENYPFVRFFAEEKLPNTFILNPLQELQKADKPGERVFFENDIHLNANGQRVLARYVRANLDL